jgi:hypothetical protein
VCLNLGPSPWDQFVVEREHGALDGLDAEPPRKDNLTVSALCFSAMGEVVLYESGEREFLRRVARSRADVAEVERLLGKSDDLGELGIERVQCNPPDVGPKCGRVRVSRLERERGHLGLELLPGVSVDRV